MNKYLKYTNLAFQLILFIFAGNYFGKWIAEYFGYNPATGSAVGILILLILGLIKIVRDVLADMNDK